MRWFATMLVVQSLSTRAVKETTPSLISLGGKPAKPTSGPADLSRDCLSSWAGLNSILSREPARSDRHILFIRYAECSVPRRLLGAEGYPPNTVLQSQRAHGGAPHRSGACVFRFV